MHSVPHFLKGAFRGAVTLAVRGILSGTNGGLICTSLGFSSQIGKKRITRNLSRICFDRGGNLGGRYFDCRHGRIRKVGRIRNIFQKTECERSPDNHKMKNSYFVWQMVQQNYQGETTNSENPL